MTNFEKELIELMEKHKVEISVDLDYGYDGASINTIDFTYVEDEKMKSLYVKGRGSDGEIDSQLVKNALKDK